MTTSPSPESIFFAALEKANPAERAAYLDLACHGDSDLRQQVERLLEAHAEVGSFMQKPLADRPADEALGSGERADPRPLPDSRGETQAHDRGSDEAGAVPYFLTPSQKPGALGRLDHYEVLEVVGRGGMGIVLKGYDEKLHRVVALKILAAELAVSGTARQRFIREARAAAAVSHEHVVTIHAVEEDHRPPYLVMQFVDGVSLQEKLDNEGPLGLKEIMRIGLQTAEGLAAAHRQGLVHRDVKPANILLENGVERVKLTDFGLARAVDDASLTQSGVIAGTPLYMSPEQAAGEPIDHRSDLFSLGSVLYVLCTGRPPFRADGTQAVLRRVIEDTPRPIREVNPEIPDGLCDVIAQLHAKKPADRFSSAQEVAERLGQHLARLQQPGQAALPRAVARPPSAGPVWKRRWVAGPVAALLLLLGLGGGLFLANQAGWLFPSPGPAHSQDSGPGSAPGKDGGDKARAQPSAPKPLVPPAVLAELRNLVAVQDAHFRVAQQNYEAGWEGSNDAFFEAVVLMFEARLKLAAAEGKPVVPLLEDLVRTREDQLRIAQARLVSTGTQADVLKARAHLSEVRARLSAARADSPPGLDLRGPPVTDAGLKELAGLKQLRSLNLSSTLVTDAGLKELAGLKQLESLDLENTKVTDAGLKELAGLPQLRSLNLAYTAVTEAGLKELARLPQLQSLTFGSLKGTDAGLKELARLKQLRSLNLGYTPVTDAGLRELAAGLEQLRSLDLDGREVTEAGLRELARMKQLQSLTLQDIEVSDAGLKELAQLPQLQSLTFGSLKVTSAGLKELARLPQLQSLTFSHSVADVELKELAGLKQLRSLNLSSTLVTDADLKALAGLKQLQSLDLRYTMVTDAGLKELARMKQLQSLDLLGPEFTNAGLKELAGMKQLRSLTLNNTRVTDAGLKELAGLQQLRSLDLRHTKVTDAGLKDLAGLQQLQSLDIAGAEVTDAGLKELAGLKQLRSLNLYFTRVTDAGLKELAGLKQLQSLDLRLTMTGAGVADLMGMLPGCSISR